MQITITPDGIGLSILVVLFLSFIYSFLPKLKGSKGKKEVMTLESGPNEKPDEVPLVATVVEENVIPDEPLSAVAEKVTDADVDAAVEGVIVEQKIEVIADPISTVFLGIDMAPLPLDLLEGKRVRWLREQMGALQPEDMKRPVPFDMASSRLRDYYLYLGEQTAKALFVEAAESVSPTTS